MDFSFAIHIRPHIDTHIYTYIHTHTYPLYLYKWMVILSPNPPPIEENGLPVCSQIYNLPPLPTRTHTHTTTHTDVRLIPPLIFSREDLDIDKIYLNNLKQYGKMQSTTISLAYPGGHINRPLLISYSNMRSSFGNIHQRNHCPPRCVISFQKSLA